MTPVTSTPLKRICPAIQSESGKPLVVELTDTDGGTMTMRWKGDRKAEPIEVSLSDLMAYAEGKIQPDDSSVPTPVAPVKAGTIRWADLKSRAHTIPCENMPARIALIQLIGELEIYHGWMDAGQPGSWSSWKEEQTKPKTEE